MKIDIMLPESAAGEISNQQHVSVEAIELSDLPPELSSQLMEREVTLRKLDECLTTFEHSFDNSEEKNNSSSVQALPFLLQAEPQEVPIFSPLTGFRLVVDALKNRYDMDEVQIKLR